MKKLKKNFPALDERNFKMLTFEELDAAKEGLSSFDGSQYEGNFIGGIAPKFDTQRAFNMQVTTVPGTGIFKTLILFPGLTYNRGAYANGEIRTAAVGSEFASAEGTAAQFAAAGSPGTIEQLLAWVNANPVKIIGMKIKSTDATQLEQTLFVERQSPFRSQNATEPYLLSAYTDEYAQNDKIATIQFRNQVDCQTKMSLLVKQGTTLNVTFFFGPVDNRAANFAAAGV